MITPELKIKEELPVIALKNIVLFPKMVAPLLFQRTKSMKALEEAMRRNRLALFVTQKSIEDEIDEKQLFRVGTIGRIVRVAKLSDGSSRAEVEGLSRAEITEFVQNDPFFKAKFKAVSLEEDARDVEYNALIRHLSEQFVKLSSELGRPVSHDIMSLVQQVNKDPEQLITLIVANLHLEIEEQQDILETTKLKDLLKKTNSFLARNLDIVDAEKKVAKETRKQIGKMQREIFLREQMKSIEKELGVEGEKGEVEAYRKKIKDAKMPKEIEAKAFKELARLEKMPSFSPEVAYLRTYLDWVVDMPWSKKSESSIDLKGALKILDEDHYGLDKVKERIIEYLAVQKQVGKIRGPILCFVGPPGVGKTSLGKSIARALGREFHRISLGGIRDEAEIRGHRRTYVGALPGRIIQGIHSVGTRNPVFMLDEIDKVGADFRGDPSSALLEALDPEQNFAFSDHYLELPFDLSDVLFITTANVLDTIPPPLQDRLEIIEFAGYTEDEKLHIAQKYLIPKLKKEHGLKSELQFEKDAIIEIIRKYTREAGVRNLERELAKIFRKVVRQLIEHKKKKKEKQRISKAMVKKYLGPERFLMHYAEKEDDIGIVTGLGWTPVGGEVISIEATRMPGKGRFNITGRLGKVMQESAHAAISYARSKAGKEGKKDDFYKFDYHVHVPSGAIPKDGPSAGIAIATAITSLFLRKKVHKEIGMTGEVTLRGKVLEIGGVKEKVLAAHRAGVKTVILPKDNKKDMLEDVPKEIQKDIKFVFVETMDDVLKVALRKK